ncbi:MAG: hypothetical protein J6M23_03930 [Bacteroidales bacterium]|nr:hypothetical protein [Bacteroidales bacterium]
MEYAYRLAPYKGKASRLTCPACNRPHCFSPYVDDAGNVLDPTVGRCNHESSCAYHKTPSDYFKEHPELREPDWRWQRPPQLQSTPKQRQIAPAPAKPANYLPDDIVRRTLRLNPRSFLLQFLQTLFDEQTIVRLVSEYRIGVTKDLSAIFYQIDESGHCRAGKIIRYNPETGHRIKDASVPVDWVHTRLKRSGVLPESWQLSQCLFGEHLLPQRPDATVCLVEAEKTAVICAGFLPEFLWLATGGKGQLGDRLDALYGRRVIAYPDIDAFDTWTAKLKERPWLSIMVSDYLQITATDQERASGADIADRLIAYRLSGKPINIPIHPIQPIQAILSQPEVAALIEDLDLQITSIQLIPQQNEDSN